MIFQIARPAFLYWGRRGPITRMAHGLVEASVKLEVESILSLSQQNQQLAEFAGLGVRLVPVSTFNSRLGALVGLRQLRSTRRQLINGLQVSRADAVITLMSHVWSPFLATTIKRAGLPYGVIVHDADPHPGDVTGLATQWLLRDAAQADVVFALSRQTAIRLEARGFDPTRIVTLFHPSLNYRSQEASPARSGPVRLLFFGRMLSYKGVGIFAEALEILRRDGLQVRASVIGEGNLGGTLAMFSRLGVDVRNHWVADDEIGGIFAAHDIVVATHTEASQSGVVATALAHGRPVVVTPVGGLVDQIEHGSTGLIAEAPSGPAVAAALRRLILDPIERSRMERSISETAAERSCERFLTAALSELSRRTAR